jgi:precorrin-6B methylase 2
MTRIRTSISICLSALGVLSASCERNEPALTPASSPISASRQPLPALENATPSRIADEATSEPPSASFDPVGPSVVSEVGGGASAATAPPSGEAAAKKPDVVYVPTPQPIVDKMLALAKVKKSDVVYDLGCGDGRIVVTAAKRYGARSFGFDIDPQRVAEANENVKKNGVEDLVTIEQKDIFVLDLSPADVVTLYLLPELNVRLVPQLEKLKPGSRIVSHDYDIEGVKPLTELAMKPTPTDREHPVYLWTIPLKRK